MSQALSTMTSTVSFRALGRQDSQDSNQGSFKKKGNRLWHRHSMKGSLKSRNGDLSGKAGCGRQVLTSSSTVSQQSANCFPSSPKTIAKFKIIYEESMLLSSCTRVFFNTVVAVGAYGALCLICFSVNHSL